VFSPHAHASIRSVDKLRRSSYLASTQC
jgi:hypothetical protein